VLSEKLQNNCKYDIIFTKAGAIQIINNPLKLPEFF